MLDTSSASHSAALQGASCSPQNLSLKNYDLKHAYREPAPTIWEAAAAVPEGAGILRPAMRPYSMRPQAKAWCMRSRVTISRTVLYLSGDEGGGKQGSGSAAGWRAIEITAGKGVVHTLQGHNLQCSLAPVQTE